jgi:hypothetical protein
MYRLAASSTLFPCRNRTPSTILSLATWKFLLAATVKQHTKKAKSVFIGFIADHLQVLPRLCPPWNP